MKIIRKISFVLINAAVFGAIGFYAGMQADQFFYPGTENQRVESDTEVVLLPSAAPMELKEVGDGALTDAAKAYGVSRAVASTEETLCVDTEYLVQEIDLNSGKVEETSYKLPIQYVGMNRNQFIESMDVYQNSPPLSELERGFKNIEVASFSREKVVVKMSYEFVQPTECYYIAAYDNEIVVYLEDKKTIYIETGISLDSLPDELKVRVIEMYRVEDESILFDFLENYTS